MNRQDQLFGHLPGTTATPTRGAAVSALDAGRQGPAVKRGTVRTKPLPSLASRLMLLALGLVATSGEAARRPAATPFAFSARSGPAATFSADGPTRLGTGSGPTVASDGAGHPLVVWQQGERIVGWRALGDDTLVDFTITPEPGSTVGSPAVAAAADGTAILVWQVGERNGASALWSILLGGDGLPVFGSLRRLEASNSRTLQTPVVALRDDAAAFAVAWSERAPSTSGGLGRAEVRLAVWGRDGTRRGEVLTLTDSAEDLAYPAALVALDDGNFATLWSHGPRRTLPRWSARVIGADGRPLAPPSEVGAQPFTAQLLADERGFVTLHVPFTSDGGEQQWVETHYDFAGALQGGAPSFPYNSCPGLLSAPARQADLRSDYLCTQSRVAGSPLDRWELLAHRVFYTPPTTFAALECPQASGVGCATPGPVFGAPAAFQVTFDSPAGPVVGSHWWLAWSDDQGVWLHRYTTADYLRLGRRGLRVQRGETARLEVVRVGSGTGQVTVDWAAAAAAADTAEAGRDFVADAGRFTWADGDRSPRTVDIATLDDGSGREEVFSLLLANPTGPALLGAPARQRVTVTSTPDRCTPGFSTLCLSDGRFSVEAQITNPWQQTSAPAGATPWSELAGLLWFDDPRNPELAIKILDFGDRIKVFYAQLTDFPFVLAVTDHHTGTTRSFRNTPGNCGGLDQDLLAPPSRLAPGLAAPKRLGACPPDALCPLDGRYEIRVEWANPWNGTSGTAAPVTLTDLAGGFTFADPRNLELVVKLLDFGDRVLFLSGAMSDLAYTIRVREVATGSERQYENPAGRLCGVLDPDAFSP